MWNAVAPRSTELPFLAHVRQVDPEDQEIVTGTREDEWFSVIVGNCVPRGSSSTLYVAYLVSLEGFESYLPDRGEAPRGTNLRLLALASWTFNSRGRDLFFKQLMADLDVDVLRLREAPEPDGKVIRATTTSEPTVHALPPVEQVAAALGLGYTALDYQTRVGERTAAWYRGPCLPVDMRRNMQPPYTTAESALIYEPTDGMFDVSYAVDWQTGHCWRWRIGSSPCPSCAGSAKGEDRTAAAGAHRPVRSDSVPRMARGTCVDAEARVWSAPLSQCSSPRAWCPRSCQRRTTRPERWVGGAIPAGCCATQRRCPASSRVPSSGS